MVVLCESREVATLAKLPFVGLLEDVNSILNERASKSDILQSPNYYNILFALHVHRGNLRKGSTLRHYSTYG